MTMDKVKEALNAARSRFEKIKADPHNRATPWIICDCELGIEKINEALTALLARNMARSWPDHRTLGADEAIEHDRTGDARD